MVGREPVQHVHQRHAIPAHRPRPHLGAQAGRLVRPRHLFRFVPPMPQQPGLLVAHVRVHQQQLLGNVVEVLRLLEGRSVFRTKRLRHVRAIQPHLVGINLFVPVASAHRARLHSQLIVQELRRLRVLLLLRHPVEQQIGAAHLHVVQGMRVGLVGRNCAVCGHILIHRGLDVRKIVAVPGGMPFRGHPIQQRALFVRPLVMAGHRPLLQDSCRHLLGRRGLRECGSGDECEHQDCCEFSGQRHGVFLGGTSPSRIPPARAVRETRGWLSSPSVGRSSRSPAPPRSGPWPGPASIRAFLPAPHSATEHRASWWRRLRPATPRSGP